MNESQTFGFAKLVPGFDFLQNLAKGSAGAMPPSSPLSSWIAPTLSVEELDKRIQDLRAVQFWLEQNGKALAATIQALEVQKMTLSTLQGMNLSMNELAESLKFKPAAAPASSASPEAPAAAKPGAGAPPFAKAPSSKGRGAADKAAPASATPPGSAVDPLQWWGALSQQFQQIAQSALQEVAASAAASGTSRGTAASKTSRAAAGSAKPAKASRSSGAASAKRASRSAARTPRT